MASLAAPLDGGADSVMEPGMLSRNDLLIDATTSPNMDMNPRSDEDIGAVDTASFVPQYESSLLDSQPASEPSRCKTPVLEDRDTFPQYTLVSPTKRSPKKLRHTRGNSSLQEPDMAVLLARLENENTALAKDPKSGMAAIGAHTGPDSAFEYKVRDTVCSSLSTIVIPEETLGMTLGEFWALVTSDYKHALSSMPTMTPLMLHKGVPELLRSAVWVGISGATDPALQREYDSLVERLRHEEPPNENIINKDLARCFPQHELFKDVDGEGQRMLGLVLKAYSLYDPEVGYCQGMAFVVGILLLNMVPQDAFCVLVKLMETHDLRSMYSPSLSGLHSRTFQLKSLLGSIAPDLLSHLSALGVELAYLSQWFMTLFATTCPFNVMFRLFDVIFAEGADATVMRTALALIVTNEERIMAMTELEEVVQLLLGRSLWDSYIDQPDFLIDEVARLCNVVTKAELDGLHDKFIAQSKEETGTVRALGFTSGLAGLKFFDAWLPSMKQASRSASISTLLDMPGHRASRSISKRSIATIDSSVRSGTDSMLSSAGTASTFPTDLESLAEHDTRSIWGPSPSLAAAVPSCSPSKVKPEDRLHNEQVEGLLLALTEVQREAAQTAAHLHEERAKKESMSEIVHRLRDLVTNKETSIQGMNKRERRQTMPSRTTVVNQAQDILEKLNQKSAAINIAARSSIMGPATLSPATDELQQALARLCVLLASEPATPASEQSPLDARSALPTSATDKSAGVSQHRKSVRLSLTHDITEYDDSTPMTAEMLSLRSTSYFPDVALFNHVEDYQFPTEPVVARPRRTSSLAASSIPVQDADAEVPTEDAILMELVNAKTREATAIHQRDEMKVELDRLKKAQELQQVREDELTTRMQEMERLLLSQRQAHSAELAKALSAGMQRTHGSRTASRSASVAPSVLEIHTERSNSLWPSEAPASPALTSSVPQSADSVSPSSWWWSRNKQRSISAGDTTTQ